MVMKKSLFVVMMMCVLMAMPAFAGGHHGHHSVSVGIVGNGYSFGYSNHCGGRSVPVGIGVPVYSAPIIVAPRPVIVAPRPVICSPPVVYQTPMVGGYGYSGSYGYDYGYQRQMAIDEYNYARQREIDTINYQRQREIDAMNYQRQCQIDEQNRQRQWEIDQQNRQRQEMLNQQARERELERQSYAEKSSPQDLVAQEHARRAANRVRR